MAIFIIGYDLRPSLGEDYSSLYKAIKAISGVWAHPVDSTWLVSTAKSAKEIRIELMEHIYDDDKLLVMKVRKAWSSHGLDNDVLTWLHERNFN